MTSPVPHPPRAHVRSLRVAALLAVALPAAAACSPKMPHVEPVDRGAGPDAARDPLGAALHADVVARAGTMEEVPDAARRGALDAQHAGDVGLVLQAGYCYGILARGEASVGDLRIRLVDSNRDPRQVDRDTGPFASVGLAEPLCPEPTTDYRLELRGSAPGAFAVRVFRAAAL